ncbi:hypothetical protein Tco_0494614 [Tanacetum coccineum]
MLMNKWFDLSADLLRKALAITPVNPTHPFELPPSGNTVIDFVNELGYPEPVEIDRTFGSDNTDASSAHAVGNRPLKLNNNNIHRRPDSAVHHTGDDYILGNLKFVPKGESVEVIWKRLLKNTQRKPLRKSSVQPAQACYTQKATTNTVKQSKQLLSTKKPSKRKLLQKVRKGKPTFQLVDEDDEAQQESIPQEEDDDPDLECETETAAPKGEKDQGEVDSSTVTSGVSIPVSDPEKAHEALAGPDPEPMKEDQTRSDSGKLHVSLAGPNPEHMDDEFLSIAYPKVHENLKLITDERVIDDKPESHSGSIHQTVTSTPPVIAPFTDVSSSKPSLLVTPPPINTEATTITTSLPEITPFITLQLRVAKLEQEMSEVKKTDHSANVLASIRSQVPTAVDKYLGTKLDDALLKVLERHTVELIGKYSVLPGPESTDKVDLEEFDLSADKVKDHKRKHDSDDDEDDDDDEGPSAGSNQGSSDALLPKQLQLFIYGMAVMTQRDAVVDSSMPRSDTESEHSEQSSDDIPMQDEGHVSDMEDTDNAHTFPRRTGKKKLCKADLEGPAFNLVKAFHKNNIFLPYQMDECHKEPSDREAVKIADAKFSSVISVKVSKNTDITTREIILCRADYRVQDLRKDFRNLHHQMILRSCSYSIFKKSSTNLPRQTRPVHNSSQHVIIDLVIKNRVGDLQLGIEVY